MGRRRFLLRVRLEDKHKPELGSVGPSVAVKHAVERGLLISLETGADHVSILSLTPSLKEEPPS